MPSFINGWWRFGDKLHPWENWEGGCRRLQDVDYTQIMISSFRTLNSHSRP